MYRNFLSLLVGICIAGVATAGCDTTTAGGAYEKPAQISQTDSDYKSESSASVSIGDPPPPPAAAEDDQGKPAVIEKGAEPKAGEEVAVLETTQGQIVLRFFPKVAPGHVKNFMDLAKKGFYDGTKFHRAVPGFMIQGGDPNTKTGAGQPGTGDPGYKIKAEFNDTKHVRGTLSMARSQDPDSAGSQFFICVDKASFLDGQYTAFGQVVSGMKAVDRIVNLPTSGEMIADMDQAVIKSVKIQKWPLKK